MFTAEPQRTQRLIVLCFPVRGTRRKRLRCAPESTKVQLAIKFQKNHVPSRKMVFYLAASHRQMKTSLLCGLCVFAVRIQFGLLSC
jgi:hypothetical protein